MKSVHPWTRVGWVCHLFIALAVLTQLITSLIFEGHSRLADNAFLVHEISGTTALCVLIVYIVYHASCAPSKYAHLFPWFTFSGCQEIAGDIKALLRLRIPVRQVGGLAGTVQGLGLLLVLTMASTGTLWLVSRYILGWMAGRSFAMSIHHALGNLVWVYLIGHTVMALLHWVLPKVCFQQQGTGPQ